MLVEQALFTSAQTRQSRGYHLVARSPGVTDRLVQTLSVWGPTHDSLIGKTADAISLNYFAADDDWRVLSRTVYGPSEYSGRGGFRVETNLALLRRGQLSGYGNNPLAVARIILALGYLRLRTSAKSDLNPLKLPESTLIAERMGAEQDVRRKSLIDEILDKLRDRRVAVIGERDAASVVASVLNRLPERHRDSLSFTTGLKPSLHRKFDLQFLPSAENHARRELEASGVVCLDVGSP
ncbi:MAG: hypothetical protein AB7U20_14515 [Planctomycetaceae bacterium]